MNVLLKKVYEKEPKVNEIMTNGFAVQEVPKAMEYFDKVINSSMKSANPKFKYLGYRKLTPMEEYKEKISKRNHDISGSDVVLYELFFEYDGQKIPRKFIYIPFVRDAGIMEISGTKYGITPVLTDTVISPSDNEVFLRLLKIKQFFRNITRNIIKNNENLIGEIVYSDGLAMLDDSKTNMLGKVVVPVSLFVIGKYGLMDTFKKYCKTAPILTSDNEKVNKLRKTHDVYTTTKIKPKTLKGNVYEPHNIHICILKKDNNSLVEKIACGLIYTFDVLPGTAVNIEDALKASKDIELTEWRIIIGRIAYKDFYTPGRAYDLIMDKYNVIESYLDTIVQEKLEETGIFVSEYFDLLIHMTDKYSEYLLKGKEYTNNIYNRYIDILYYLMFSYIYGMNRTIQDVNNMSKNKVLTVQNVSKLMTRRLSSKTIFSITKSGSMNICISPIDSTTDSMFTKITGLLELQERGRGVVKEKNNAFPINTRKITGTDLYLGSIYNLPKKTPTPKVRLNPYAQFDPKTNRIDPPPELRKKIDLLDYMLSGRTDDFAAANIITHEEIDEVQI